jgi:outer membrane protein TolC
VFHGYEGVFAPARTARVVLLILLVAPTASAAEPETGADSPSPPLPVVTWQQAIDRALARNPTATVARQEIARADALVREARAGWLPVLTGNGNYTRIDTPRTLNGVVTAPVNAWNGNLQLTVPLIAPTGWMNDVHAQDNRAVAVVAAADVRRQVASSVGRAYLTVLLQHRQLEVALRARETAAAHYQYAHTRLTGGLGNSVDDARAEQELRADEAQVGSVRAALVRAQSALAILLSEEGLVDANEDVQLAAVAPGAVDAVVASARNERTDVRALQARLSASQHLVRDQWVYYAPSLAVVAQSFTQTETPLLRGRGWQAQLVLSLPLYDGGFRYGVRRERKALEDEARTQWEAALRQASVEVRASFQALYHTDQSLSAAQAAAKAADTAAKLADQAYRAGATTNLEVIDAERRARDAATQAALAEDAARQSRLDLLVASGRFP